MATEEMTIKANGAGSYPVVDAVPIPRLSQLPQASPLEANGLSTSPPDDLPVARVATSASTGVASTTLANGICLKIQRRSKDAGRGTAWYLDYYGHPMGKLMDGTSVNLQGIKPGDSIGVTVRGLRHTISVKRSFDAQAVTVASSAMVDTRESALFRRLIRKFWFRSMNTKQSKITTRDEHATETWQEHQWPPTQLVIRLKSVLSIESSSSSFTMSSRMWIEPTRTLNPHIPGWLEFGKNPLVAVE